MRKPSFFIFPILLSLGLLAAALAWPSSAALAANCCCLEIEVTGGDPIRQCKLQDGECVPPYQYTNLDERECAGVVVEETTGETRGEPIYFTPNAPIPGVFEGPQAVDGTLLSRYIRSFYVYFVWIVGILAVVMTMYAGIQWITAAGNASRIENAKSTMNGALIGLVLTLTSFVLLQAINPSLVTLEDLSVFTVPTQLVGERGEVSDRGDTAAGLPETPQDLSNVRNVARWDMMIKTISAEFGVDATYVKAIMMIESRGNPLAISPKGACGLMQVLPINSGGVCLVGEDKAEQNMRAGVQYIKQLIGNTCPTSARYKSGTVAQCNPSQTNCTSGNWRYVIAAYNGGPGANCSSLSCPPAGPGLKGQTWWECVENEGYRETRKYVDSVTRMRSMVLSWGGLE